MRTNQVLTVALGGGELTIEHLTELGSLIEIFEIGNKYRLQSGLKSLRHDQWLALEGTKNFIATVEKRVGKPAIKSKRGRGGGIWAHLYILLDAAAYLSPELKFEVYETFVHGKLLEWRDRSGDDFIDLNVAIALNAEAVFGKPAHKGHYITLSKTIRDRCGVENWNTATHLQLQQRAKIEEAMATMLRLKLVRDWDHLKELTSTI